MTTQTAAVSLDALDTAIAAATGQLGEDEQRLAVAVFRLLSAGHPVRVPAAADAAGMPGPPAETILRSWPAVFWDEHGQVTGFWGLALAGMPPHRIDSDGTELSAWCAWDPLFLARIIGDLQVTTADPATGQAITYRISRDGAITGASHPEAVLSFLRPDKPWDDAVMTSFCHYVQHFTSPATARQWTAEHPGTFVISLADAAELARRHTARFFGTAAAA
jgi:alkylmercury lyase-like protein